VSAVLLPTHSLETVSHEARVSDVERLCAATGFSRFPVTGADGALVGYLHIQDVLDPAPGAGRRRIDPGRVRSFVATRPTNRLHEALAALRQRGAHMSVVVDDDGAVLGVVTLEDILEELVGEIRDAAHTPGPFARRPG
jgi:CBS domain containing-hemolysin-like protein